MTDPTPNQSLMGCGPELLAKRRILNLGSPSDGFCYSQDSRCYATDFGVSGLGSPHPLRFLGLVIVAADSVDRISNSCSDLVGSILGALYEFSGRCFEPD